MRTCVRLRLHDSPAIYGLLPILASPSGGFRQDAGRGNGVRPRIEAAGAALLEKPFGQSALLACIDAVLAGR